METRFFRAYEDLIARSKEIALISSCATLLGWDEETNLPRGGAAHRSDQQALLAGLEHQRAIDPRIGELLVELESDPAALEGSTIEAANVRELRRRFDRATRLSRPLVETLARTATLAQDAWLEARASRQFEIFEPWLHKIVELKREEAAAVAGSGDAYDALLGNYEPNARWSELSVLFDALDRELVPLKEAAIAAAHGDPQRLVRTFGIEHQRELSHDVASRIGFDFSRGRIDVAPHPSTMWIGPGDCRITTLYRLDDLVDGLFSTLHEVGHGLYDQGLDPRHYGTPAGEAASLGLHESQSRLIENIVGRRRSFWSYFYRRAQAIFAPTLDDLALDDFLAAVNRVAVTPIRFRADEVTYNIHILIRVELERALLSGALRSSDLPGAWREAYQRRLGIAPADDTEGCLQDGHWAAGMFGYFPTYLVGNMIAAQLYEAAERDVAELDRAFAAGDFSLLLAWLRDRVHRHGQSRSSAEIVERATGRPLDHRALVKHLHRRYVTAG